MQKHVRKKGKISVSYAKYIYLGHNSQFGGGILS
jgi:hypothetical protein